MKKPAAAAPPAKSDADAMWGEDPVAAAPPPAAAPVAPPSAALRGGKPSRAGRVINTGRPPEDTVGNIKTVGGVVLTILVLVGLGIRFYVRWNNSSSSRSGWQTVENSMHDLKPGDVAGGTVHSEISGKYIFEVQAQEGDVGVAIVKTAGAKATTAEMMALMLALKKIPQGRTETTTGAVIEGYYLWVVKNLSDEKPARAHVLLKGAE